MKTSKIAIPFIAGLTFLASCGLFGDLSVSVICNSAEGFEIGTPVTIIGVQVGEIKKINLTSENKAELKIGIYRDHRKGITEDTKFVIHNGPDPRSPKSISAKPGKGNPAPNNHIFVAQEDQWISSVKNWFYETIRNSKETNIKKELEELQEATEEAYEAGLSEWNKREPELREQAEKILKEMEKGGEEAAQAMREKMEELLENSPGNQ